MEQPTEQVQAMVENGQNWIVAYGQFPSGTSEPNLYVVDVPPDQVPMLSEPGQKVWDPTTETISIADLPKAVKDFASGEREETEGQLAMTDDPQVQLDLLTKLTLTGR